MSEENTNSEVRDGASSGQIDINELLTSLNKLLGDMSDVVGGEDTNSILAALDQALQDVDNMDTNKPAEYDANSENPSVKPEPTWSPVDKAAIKKDLNDVKAQVQEIARQVEQGRQALQEVESLPETFGLRFADCAEQLNDYVEKIARTQAGQGSAFNTEDKAHVDLAIKYIKAMAGLLIAIIKRIVNHFKELTEYEKICVALIPIAAAAAIIGNVMKMSAKLIGSAFKLTIIGAFMFTGLDDAVEKFIKIAAEVIKIAGSVAGLAIAVIGHLDADFGNLVATIERIFAYVYWCLDCITHATDVMAVEPVPKLPIPICGWDIADPYDWVAGEVEPAIQPFIPDIVKGMTSPSSIVQGTNKTPMVKNYIPKKEYEVPKMEFDGGGAVFV